MKKAKDPTLVVRIPRSDRDDEAQFAQQVLAAEAAAIQRIKVDPTFHDAVDLILEATDEAQADRSAQKDQPTAAGKATGRGAVVVSGLGKSGLIGGKISATLASTGTPSHFLHPTEAMHGDLGRVRSDDVVLVLSFGGNTEEVVALATILRQDRVPVISIVGTADCDLGRLSTVCLCVGDVAEACPHNLAPTASTTAMLALGDALALAVGRRRRFGVDEFRKNHPGGMLGKQLMPIVQAMRVRAGQGLPVVVQNLTVEQALKTDMDRTGLRRAGALLVVDEAGRLTGIFTDSDLRRLLIQDSQRALTRAIRDVMTANPRRLTPESLVRDAVQLVREYRIDEVPVVDHDQKPLGLIDVQDLIALKVIEG